MTALSAQELLHTVRNITGSSSGIRLRQDLATGKLGVRVRRWLGTQAEVECRAAPGAVERPSRRSEVFAIRPSSADAARRSDPRIVDIFFDKMVSAELDFASMREAVIRVPESEPDGYRRVLCIGTTGAGKTILVRQLIGTNPSKERFPSTSTVKTTIRAYRDRLLADGGWRTVVTFDIVRRGRREHLNECISADVLSAAMDAHDYELLRLSLERT